MIRSTLLAATILTMPMNAWTEPQRVHSWTRMDFTFQTEAARAAFEDAGTYARAHLAGVEVDAAGNIYVTTPRRPSQSNSSSPR